MTDLPARVNDRTCPAIPAIQNCRCGAPLTRGVSSHRLIRRRRMRIAIFGGKGGAEIAAHSVARLAEAWPGIALVGYLNDQLAPGAALAGGTVLGPFASWTELPG